MKYPPRPSPIIRLSSCYYFKSNILKIVVNIQVTNLIMNLLETKTNNQKFTACRNIQDTILYAVLTDSFPNAAIIR
jgi:hypothetical protein